MANSTVMQSVEIETALERAKSISVLSQWIERSRDLAQTFDHLLKYDENFAKRCKENAWFSLTWDEEESKALAYLMGIQEECLRELITANNEKVESHA